MVTFTTKVINGRENKADCESEYHDMYMQLGGAVPKYDTVQWHEYNPRITWDVSRNITYHVLICSGCTPSSECMQHAPYTLLTTETIAFIQPLTTIYDGYSKSLTIKRQRPTLHALLKGTFCTVYPFLELAILYTDLMYGREGYHCHDF